MGQSSQIYLEKFQNLSVADYVIDGWHLWQASRHNAQLAEELPLVERGYSNPRKAAARLARIKRTAGRHSLAPYVIRTRGEHGESAIGVVSLQSQDSDPTKSLPQRQVATEVSYWHDLNPAIAVDVGKVVVATAVKSADHEDSEVLSNFLWTLILPGDHVKERVFKDLGFVEKSEPQVYNIGDGVSTPRQLLQGYTMDVLGLDI